MKNGNFKNLCDNVFTNSDNISILEQELTGSEDIQIVFNLNSNININGIDIVNISSLSIADNIVYLHRDYNTYEAAIDIRNKYIVIEEIEFDNFNISLFDYQKEFYLEESLEIQYPKYPINIREEIIDSSTKIYIADINIINSIYSVEEKLYSISSASREELMFKVNELINNIDSVKYLFTEYGKYDYIYCNEMIFKVKALNGSRMICDIISNKSETFESELDISSMFNKQPIIFKSSDIIVYNDIIIRDGVMTNTIEDLNGFIDKNYRKGLIVKLSMDILSLAKISSSDTIDIELASIIYNRCLVILDKIKDIDIFNKFDLNYNDKIIYPVLGTALLVSEETIDIEINNLNKIYSKIQEMCR